MKRRMFPVVLALALLLTGCGRVRTEPWEDSQEPQTQGPVLAYVPLDDRPDNVERAVYLAQSAGYQVVMPKADWYRTRLDGQPRNENGTGRGDSWALYQWVLEQEEAGCDHYILSLDQLLFGGLVSSRTLTAEDCVITLPDGDSIHLQQMLENLLAVLSADPNNAVWLLDSVMRLAPTVGYQGGTLEDYNWLRAFGALPRQTLEGDALTLESIADGYLWGPNQENLCSQTAEEQGAAQSEETLAAYLSAREGKLTFSSRVQALIARPGYENFRLLVGIDDSSLEDCIQKNEIAFLRQGLRTNGEGQQLDWILSGVDDLAFKAIARLCLDEGGWSGCPAAVRYYGGTEDRPACAYDFQPLREIVAEHFAFFGMTEAEEAALQVLVLTQPAEAGAGRTEYEALIRDLQDCRKNGQPVILIDAGNGRYGTEFHAALTEETELGWLLSYAGFLDMAIVTGTALSHGVTRYAVLKSGGGDEAMERSFARTLADSILKDFCYKNGVREDLLACIRNDLGGDPNNFWLPPLDIEDLVSRLEQGMDAAVQDVIANLERSNLLVTLDTNPSYPSVQEERGWGGIALEDYRFPWDRAFEIGMDIHLGPFTEPHKTLLGISVQ